MAEQQNYKTKMAMRSTSITDVPNEVIQKSILMRLDSHDVSSFGMTGIDRFEQIAEDVIEKRSK